MSYFVKPPIFSVVKYLFNCGYFFNNSNINELLSSKACFHSRVPIVRFLKVSSAFFIESTEETKSSYAFLEPSAAF